MEEPDFAAGDEEASAMPAVVAVASAPSISAPAEAPPAGAAPMQVVMPPGTGAGVTVPPPTGVTVPPPGQPGFPAVAPMVVAPDGSFVPGGVPGLQPEGTEPPIPEPEEEGLPFETDADGWLELLRDGYLRQLREENEYPEPPAYNRAMHFAAREGEPVPPGKYPKTALNIQLHLLLRARGGEAVAPNKGGGFQKGKGVKGMGKGGYGGGGGNQQMLQIPAQALPGLLMQMRGKGGQMNMSGGPGQAQLLLEAAKAIVGSSGGGGLNLDWNSIKGKGKGKDKGKAKWSPNFPPVQKTI